MGRSIEVSGRSILLAFYAVSLPSLVAIFAAVLWPPDDPATLGVGLFIAVLVVAFGVGEWRRRTGRESEHLGTDGDLASSNLYSYLGRTPKQRKKASGQRSGDDGD